MADFKKIENIRDYVEGVFWEGKKAQYFVKKAFVEVREAKVGEEVVTYVMGRNYIPVEETRQVVEEKDQFVVKNPNGEVYVVSGKELTSRYELVDAEKGIWNAIAKPRRLIQIEEDITFPAPWGGDMNIQKDGWLNIDDMNGIYGINPAEFNQTHIPFIDHTKKAGRDAK